MKSNYSEDRIYEDLHEVIEVLVRQDKSSRPSAFLWSKVADSVHKQLLYMIAAELSLPNPRLIPSKSLEKHSFSFLNGASLNGLYSYYKNRMVRKPGIHIITNICNKLNIPEVTLEDWFSFIKINNIFSWKSVPNIVKREILISASKELGYRHPLFLTNDDFSRHFTFLNGKSLTGLYTYYRNQYDGARGIIIKKMCDALDITPTKEDWYAYITSPKTNIFWDIVPPDIMQEIIYKAALQLGYSNPRMLSIDDLKVGLNVLEGMSLYSFASRYFAIDKQGLRNIDFICDQFHIPQLTFEDWINMISHQRNFKWGILPNDFLTRILYLKSKDAQKEHPRMLKFEDLSELSSFINNKTLTSLYNYHRQGAREASLDTIQYMCDLAEIPSMDTNQWISIICEPNSKTSWELVPHQTIREILLKAAREQSVHNPRLLDYSDFCVHRYDFLGGKTLSGLYTYSYEKYKENNGSLVQCLCDAFEIDELNTFEWIQLIKNLSICHWDNVPINVQRDIVYKASIEMGLWHPRLMGTREFDSIPLSFLNGKTLGGLYYHYAAKHKRKNHKINEFIFDQLNIPKTDINLKTGRLNTLDNSSHKKYYDSLANLKDFVNEYLKLFDFMSLLKKYTVIRNAKEAGIYKKGLNTVFSSMKKQEYIDFLYEIIKNIPRDELGLRRSRGGDYSISKADLYILAGIDAMPKDSNRISFAKVDELQKIDKMFVLQDLAIYREILGLKTRKFHEADCQFLVVYEGSCICQVAVYFYPGDIITDNMGHEFEVMECRERKADDGYILELRPFLDQNEEEFESMKTLSKDSNDNILANYLEELQHDIISDTISPLIAVVLGLKNERQLNQAKLIQLPENAFYNRSLPANETQRQAVQLSLSLDEYNNPLAIIQGPPGTGKTTLIKEIALQYYYTGKNILILAKTNVAVDNILEKLYEDKVAVLRTGNNIERKSSLPYAPIISTSNEHYMNALGNGNCITLGTPMGFYLDRNKKRISYDLLIIDEASQMDIPESLFSLSMAKKCIIIGDHLQIPPFPIQNEVLLEFDPNISLQMREDLQRSLFEKLITDRSRYNTVFLDVNYRTDNPYMVSFISDLIYDGKLCPNKGSQYYQVPKQKRKKLFPEQTIEVIDTSEITDIEARLETELNSTYYNISEAMLSVKKVIDLLKTGESLSDISIITPYKAHAEKLKEIFTQHKKYFNNQKGINYFIEKNISTIDSFQGREQRNIIINWVRSNYGLPGVPTRTGFLRDYRRVNVALSRARIRLILIGDYETLTKSDNQRVRHMFNQIKQIKINKKIVL